MRSAYLLHHIRVLITLAIPVSLVSPAYGQTGAPKLWASVTFNKSTVTVGEPLVATITVYTSTWFSAPPDFGEIQSPNSMTIRLQQRSGARTKIIGGKTYPAIEQQYLVYPFQSGENVFPSLKIVVETPDEGDYKGTKRTIRSPERRFKANPLPDELMGKSWLAAYQVTLTEKWNRPLDNLKAGDVIDRQITIRAVGPPASLIPPLPEPELDFASVYPRPASLSNTQNEASLSGARTEVATYLFEKAGDFVIPGVTVKWYNPRTKKIQEKTLPAKEVTVAENPNLEFVLSMQDSLQRLLSQEDIVEETEEPFEFMGLNWWQLAIAVLTGLAVLFLAARSIRRLAGYLQRRKKRRGESEAFYFKKFREACQSGNPATTKSSLLAWYGYFREERFGPELEDWLEKMQLEELRTASRQLDEALFSERVGEGSWPDGPAFYQLVQQGRQASFKVKKRSAHIELPELNPW